MPVISVKDNKNNRWKRNAKTKQKTKKHTHTHTQNRTRGTAAITKGWEINDFVERLSSVFSN